MYGSSGNVKHQAQTNEFKNTMSLAALKNTNAKVKPMKPSIYLF